MVVNTHQQARDRQHWSVLIADEEEALRRELDGLLRTEGYDTHLAENEEQVVEIFRRMWIDLVVLEFELPPTGGLDALRAIKSTQRGIVPCVFTAVKVSSRVQLDALSEDAFTVVPKPVEPRVMKRAVWSAIRRYYL